MNTANYSLRTLLFLNCLIILSACSEESSPAPVDAGVDAAVACPEEAPTDEMADIPLTPCQLLLGENFLCTDGLCQPAPDTPCDDSGKRDHALCQDMLAANFFCSTENRCIPVSRDGFGDDCTPGPAGDDKCSSMNGPGATCGETDTRGRCGERACLGCTPFATDGDNGHACCQDALGPRWYCVLKNQDDPTGECTEAPAICIDDTAVAEECCVPLASDEGGHPSCTARRGMKSFCNFSGLGTGACTGMSSLCGCNDKPADFCTDQDPTSSCDPIGNCCKSRRCRDRGDDYCTLTFGMGSTCADGADGIKLCEIPN